MPGAMVHPIGAGRAGEKELPSSSWVGGMKDHLCPVPRALSQLQRGEGQVSVSVKCHSDVQTGSRVEKWSGT